MEDYYMGKAIERIFLPLMRLQLPEISDISMPAEGVFHNLMLVSMRKSYPGHARKVMHAIWGLGQAMFTKCIVVVDEDVDVQQPREVLWKSLNNIDPQRDIEFVLGPVDTLDHASRLADFGSKMGIDATRKWKSEGFHRPWPGLIEMSADVKRRVDELWRQAGL
jgi:4-hydroxy-3-polyprenylbenzoate decarboxylase